MSDDYKRRSYGEIPVGFGEKPGIVVVDFMLAFTEAQYPLGGAPLVMRALENTQRLVTAARRYGIPIANCTTAYMSEREMPYWKISAIVTGCNTSGCIRATSIDSFSYRYRTIVPQDCVGDIEDQPHADNLRDLGRRYVDVSDADTVLAYFDSWSRTQRQRGTRGRSLNPLNALLEMKDIGDATE